MKQRRRIILAVLISLALHGLLAVGCVLWVRYHPEPLPVEAAQPVYFTLKPPERSPAQAIETRATPDATPKPADLISDKNAQAQDRSKESGQDSAPDVDKLDEMASLAGALSALTPPSPASPASPALPPQPQTPPSPPTPTPTPETPVPEPEKPNPVSEPEDNQAPKEPEKPEAVETSDAPKAEPVKKADGPGQLALAEAKTETETPSDKQKPARTDKPAEEEVAKDQPVEASSAKPSEQTPASQPSTPTEPSPPGQQAAPGTEDTRGRVDGKLSEHNGVINFEAMQDKIAPYLLEVRRRVEKEWRAMISVKYSGTSPTRARLECVIKRDGTLASVTVLDAGDSTTYAPICRSALERAAPFPPFPFEVPDIYRSKNLEITWSFSFLEK